MSDVVVDGIGVDGDDAGDVAAADAVHSSDGVSDGEIVAESPVDSPVVAQADGDSVPQGDSVPAASSVGDNGIVEEDVLLVEGDSPSTPVEDPIRPPAVEEESEAHTAAHASVAALKFPLTLRDLADYLAQAEDFPETCHALASAWLAHAGELITIPEGKAKAELTDIANAARDAIYLVGAIAHPHQVGLLSQFHGEQSGDVKLETTREAILTGLTQAADIAEGKKQAPPAPREGLAGVKDRLTTTAANLWAWLKEHSADAFGWVKHKLSRSEGEYEAVAIRNQRETLQNLAKQTAEPLKTFGDKVHGLAEGENSAVIDKDAIKAKADALLTTVSGILEPSQKAK